MPCKYAYLLPLWIAFIVHQLVFSPYFQTLRTSGKQVWRFLMKSLRFRSDQKVQQGLKEIKVSSLR